MNDVQPGENPFQRMIKEANGDPSYIQGCFALHRSNRNDMGKTRLLSQDFPGMTIDPILVQLTAASSENHQHIDKRHCLVFWARPPTNVLALVQEIGNRLRWWYEQFSSPLASMQSLHLMHPHDLHMNTFEITNSVTALDVDMLVNQLAPLAQKICDHPSKPENRARLVNPQLSIDASGVALTFLPAAATADDAYTYQHLRRDVCDLVRSTGTQVAQRYTVPSAHMTIARWLDNEAFKRSEELGIDHATVKSWVEHLEGINEWLRAEIWPQEDWVIGEEKGFDLRKGTLWYGGGETVILGQGFNRT